VGDLLKRDKIVADTINSSIHRAIRTPGKRRGRTISKEVRTNPRNSGRTGKEGAHSEQKNGSRGQDLRTVPIKRKIIRVAARRGKGTGFCLESREAKRGSENKKPGKF